MYKVFVNDCPIILTENKNILTNFDVVNFESAKILEIVDDLFNNSLEGIYLLCADVEKCWQKFQSYFKIHKAAGGKVINSDNEVLFIYRFNRWDLPKGKLKKGESITDCAVREVEEECGVSNLKIEEELPTTYHIFKYKKKLVLKITYWFLMETSYNGNLIPQLEEDIKKVVFKDKKEIKEALANTYENIKLLF
ncbi:NUDIX hydrolase [Lutibacter sp. B1]|uniref:NUDIX hydrolase n=1 Tax=Lutibacter sp. B1 TaxID=2725996 RepID=UPI0014570436|nr:NUDIX domain-containing protein [Lutibacter sp. B1]NLP57596.1 NUDIX domain-containing protein [Lutibacter sp. B1]